MACRYCNWLFEWNEYIFFACIECTIPAVTKYIHRLLSFWHMPASSLAVPSHNAVSKQTSMFVWIRTSRLFDFQEMILNVEDKAVYVYLDKYIFAFFTKRWIQFLEKRIIYKRRSFRIRFGYCMFYICWGTSFLFISYFAADAIRALF